MKVQGMSLIEYIETIVKDDTFYYNVFLPNDIFKYPIISKRFRFIGCIDILERKEDYKHFQVDEVIFNLDGSYSIMCSSRIETVGDFITYFKDKIDSKCTLIGTPSNEEFDFKYLYQSYAPNKTPLEFTQYVDFETNEQEKINRIRFNSLNI